MIVKLLKMRKNWLFIGFISACVLGFANPHYAEMTEERPAEHFPQTLQMAANANPSSAEVAEEKSDAYGSFQQGMMLTRTFVRTCQRHILLQRFLN